VRLVSGALAAVLMVVAACQGGTAAPPVHRTDSNVSGGASSKAVTLDAHILVDQFGYRPADPKIAVIRDPKVGFDAAETFLPGSTYQLRRAADGAVIYSGTIEAWNQGAVDPSAGDRGWWFDFSSVNTPGAYFVYDVSRKLRSPTFSIAQQVYRDVLKAAVRTYFYQRAGISKATPYADSCWADGAAYMGPNQDSQAHDITDPENQAKVRDLSGGWFDAGDTNKYVTNARVAVHQLLTAYQENPSAFTDDYNIPESGNGIPDILDEVKWETDWLKKMQYPDGSVALKVGDTVYRDASPPSSDKSHRFYVPGCTSSTIAAAGMFAHASYVYSTVKGLQTEAEALKQNALNAWNHYQDGRVKQTTCDSGAVKVPGADLGVDDQNTEAVVAAIYLYAITGNASYESYIEANYTLLRPYHDMGWIRYNAHEGEALLFYTTLANANPGLKSTILANKLSDVLGGQGVYGFNPNEDLYRNLLHDYIWSSNEVRANYGESNVQVKAYNVAVPAGSAASYETRALDTLHYFHGVNPFGKVYLSNMYAYGATNSVNELFGGWFIHGSIWNDAQTSRCGPAPGFLAGGPNASAGTRGVPASEQPPVGQPPQKSYKDWNGADSSWVVNEPAIYYQSAYVQLLAAYAK
jgi:endoglucanase